MRILLLGGTGAMGVSLAKILSERGDEVFITSRRQRVSRGKLHYIQGNAHHAAFLESVLAKQFDAVVDFMIYGTEEFSQRAGKLLSSCGQYIFTSSSRVYADANGAITEASPRLLDVCRDEKYLATDEYALSKARAENVLLQGQPKNFTIIRPYITYNVERLQLGGMEKESWLYPALHGRSIPLSLSVARRKTTMTFGGDVAAAIAALIGNDRALGECFNLVGDDSITWREVLSIYEKVLCANGIMPRLYLPEKSDEICEVMGSTWQIKYDRLYDRVFDNSKLRDVCPALSFTPMREGLAACLGEFIRHPAWRGAPQVKCEAYFNKMTGEKMPLDEAHGLKEKVKYLGWYYAPMAMNVIKSIKDACRK